MFQDNPLLAQLKQQIQETLPKKEGTIKATEKGYGFLEVDSKTSIFIAPPFMKKVMHGDKVSAIIREENGKKSAEPETLIEPAISRFIARVKLIKGKLNVVPDSPQLKKVSLNAKTQKGLSADSLNDTDWVVAHLIKHPLKGDNRFFVEISEKITDGDDKIAPWWVTLAQNDLPNAEPAAPQSFNIQDDEALERIDLTELPLVTIDGASTQDMDDALHAQIDANGDIKLTIAIADPTAYIEAESEMDNVAKARAFTIYMPGRNIPMLPRELADDLCSLKQDERRAALCCTVTVKADGTIVDDAHFFAANVKSHARLAYDDVSDWKEGVPNSWQPTEQIKPVLEALFALSAARSHWRENHAVIFPDRPDYRFELSEDNDVIAIHADMRRSSNKLVEEAMITANICAGRMLANKHGFGVFNGHAGFKTDKIKEAFELVGRELNNEKYTQAHLATLEGFGELRRELTASGNAYLDSRIRKLQTFGQISNQPVPHYAMGLELYATWTSPIRKYGDMINHRLLKAAIMGKEGIKPSDELGEALGLTLKHHKIAERTIGDWLYARTLEKEVAAETEFTAEVFDINRAGMRARLIENGASVFIPAKVILNNKERLTADRDSGQLSIDGEVIYRLSSQLKVTLNSVSIDTRSIIAKPVELFGDAPTTDTSAK